MAHRIFEVSELEELLIPIFEKHGVHEAILFGSYAKGEPTAYSDVDIYVDSGLKGLQFFGLLEDVNEALKIPVDLIDRQCLYEDGPMIREIKKTGLHIYGAQST